MRNVRRVLLAASGCLAVALLAVPGSAARAVPAAIQTGSYPWVQPWTATQLVQPAVQPPAWVARTTVRVFVPPTSYPWAQPWGARPLAVTQPAGR